MSIEKLIKLLESKGFEGTDASIQESLLYYGIVRRQSDGFTILCSGEDSSPLSFGVTTIETDDIRNAIQEMKEGFYSFIGNRPFDYIQDFENDARNEVNLVMYIQDVRQYDDRLTYDIYLTLTVNEMINILEYN